MKHTEEWDWPPTRRRSRRFYRTIDYYQPSGWSSPGVRKAVDIYWGVTVFTIKALIPIPLALMVVGAVWMLWTLIRL